MEFFDTVMEKSWNVVATISWQPCTAVSMCSTVALLCYLLPRWCYFSFLVMKGAARRTTHGVTETRTYATAKSSLDTPAVWGLTCNWKITSSNLEKERRKLSMRGFTILSKLMDQFEGHGRTWCIIAPIFSIIWLLINWHHVQTNLI